MAMGRALGVGLATMTWLLAGCRDGDSMRASLTSATARFALAAARVSGQEAPIAHAVEAAVVEASGHPGFDTGE